MRYGRYGVCISMLTLCFVIVKAENLSRIEEGEETSATRHRKHKSSKYRLGFLDEMLEEYDKRAWPTYHIGRPTSVTVNINVNSIGPVNAANMQYNMDIYLRQAWVDPRLKLSRYNISNTVTMNGEDLVEKIWKPDLFFRNVKDAKFHYVTVPNKLLKISPDGDILFSMRLTLVLSCRMAFRNYPLDTQKCQIVLGPYAQTEDQVKIMWQGKDPIVLDENEVPEFDLTKFYYGHFTRAIDTGAFSFLNATFIFVRQNGYHLVQTYLPTFLIVMISWVSFWLNVDATPARVTLGVTTLLTLTTVASGVRTQLPPVSYVKAIDVWIGACSVMVFGALLEFTLVNYLSRTKQTSGEAHRVLGFFTRSKKSQNNKCSTDEGNECDEAEKAKLVQLNLKKARNVDMSCRIIFPLAFFTFNVAYWPYYLYAPSY